MVDPRAPRYLTRGQALTMLAYHVGREAAERALASDELDTRAGADGETEYRAIEIVELCGVLRRLAEGATLEELEAEADEV